MFLSFCLGKKIVDVDVIIAKIRDVNPFFPFRSQYHHMKALNERISEWPHLAL